jgi:hypothetical protein
VLGTGEDTVRLKLDSGEDVELPLGRITKAKLVLTDELIAAGSRPRT